jgi:DNA-directed RNA polymerase subunit N (RpoN/RPB10)
MNKNIDNTVMYYRCPTCKANFAKKQIPYEKALKDICNNDKLSQKEKDMEKSKLYDRFGIFNICCRARFLGFYQ